MPVLLALLLGFQHALSMLAGIITPPIIIAGQGGANLDGETAQYLVSTSLIVCGILSSVQISRFHVYRSPYYVGTGLISVVGTSFASRLYPRVALTLVSAFRELWAMGSQQPLERYAVMLPSHNFKKGILTPELYSYPGH